LLFYTIQKILANSAYFSSYFCNCFSLNKIL
jgi:hypothetical protein